MFDINDEGHKAEMERLFNSDEFQILERQLSVNNARFADLQPSIKLLAVYLLHVGGENVLGDLWRLFYLRQMPTFDEFLDSLGVTGKMTYPIWRRSLNEHFSPGSKSSELIFSGCLTGDTLISLLDGRSVPIKDLVDQTVDVLCYDTHSNQWKPSIGRDIRMTSPLEPVWKITLDNGQVVRATSNHPFLTENNKWVALSDLKVGDSLKSYNVHNRSGYDYIWDHSTKKNRSIHRVVMDSKSYVKPGNSVHHKNFIQKDNRPSNLMSVNSIDHFRYHNKVVNRNWKDPTTSQQMRESMRNSQLNRWSSLGDDHPLRQHISNLGKSRWQDSEHVSLFRQRQKEWMATEESKGVSRNNLQVWRDSLNGDTSAYTERCLKGSRSRWSNPGERERVSKLTSERMLNGFAKQMSDVRSQKMRSDPEFRQRCSVAVVERNKNPEFQFQAKRRKIISSLNKMMVDQGVNYIALHQFEEFRQNSKVPYRAKLESIAKYSLCKVEELHKIWDQIIDEAVNFNHCIISIEFDGYEPVYNMEVDKYHNFPLACGIVSHNSIGSGKSFASRLAVVYNLMRVINLTSPQLTLGKTPESVLVASLLTVTLSKAELAVYKPYINMLEKSSMFEEVNRHRDLSSYRGNGPIPYFDAGEYTEFPNNIILNIGSQVSHAISYDMFMASLDEAESRVGSSEKALDLYSELKNRVKTRFLGSRFSLLCLVSSSKSSTGVISQYLGAIEAGDPTTRIFSFPIWEVKEQDPYGNGYFYALRGTAQHPSRVLSNLEADEIEKGTWKRPAGTELYKVPKTYEREFKLSCEKALRDIAGVQSQGEDRLFDDLTMIESDYVTPELKLDVTLGDKRRIIDKLPSTVFTHIHGRKVFRRCPSAPRYMHLDLAEAAMSEAGLSIIHKEISPLGEPMYVVDLACIFTSHIRIDIGLIKQFVIDLVNECGVVIQTLSADQYQSSAVLQEFETKRIAREVVRVSVDRSDEPYLSFSRLVIDGRVKIGRAPTLKYQLENLSHIAGKIVTIKRKDLADSMVGAVWNANNAHNDFPVERFEEINKRQYGTHAVMSEYFNDHKLIKVH